MNCPLCFLRKHLQRNLLHIILSYSCFQFEHFINELLNIVVLVFFLIFFIFRLCWWWLGSLFPLVFVAMLELPPYPWCLIKLTAKAKWQRYPSSTGAPRPSAMWTPHSSGAILWPNYLAASWRQSFRPTGCLELPSFCRPAWICWFLRPLFWIQRPWLLSELCRYIKFIGINNYVIRQIVAKLFEIIRKITYKQSEF